jgi:hypothetical protein
VAGAKVTDVVAAATTAAALYAPITKSTVAIKTLNGMVAGPDLILEAKYEGAYTAGIVVKVSIPDGDIINSVVALYGLTSSDWFNIQITNSDGTTEQYNNVSVKDSARRLDRILANESRLLRVADATPLPLTTALDTGNSPYSVVSGNAGVDGNDLVPADVLGNQSTKTGIYALENADLFNLLCIPPTTAGAALDTSIIDAATTYCQSRRAMMIIDPPWSTVASAVSGTPAPSGIGAVSTNAAVFFPSLLQPNPLRGNLVEQFAPCGAVAGVMARIDASRGVWKAPAGLEAALVGVPQLSVAIGDQESGQLNQIGVNALRTLPAAGNVMWGARTRVGADRLASQWKYIPVRRLALHIEESLYRGTQWAVFQPNAEPLWAQLRLNIGTFMQDLFRQGAFQGQTPRDAYFVKCDSSTTTQSDIDQGVVNVVVGFAPLLPAEFVIITLRQIAGQSPT